MPIWNRQHPIESGIGLGLGAVNPLLGGLWRLGSSIWNHYHPDHPTAPPQYGSGIPGYGGVPSLGSWGNSWNSGNFGGGNAPSNWSWGDPTNSGTGYFNTGTNQFGLPNGPVNLTGNPGNPQSNGLPPPGTNGLGSLGQPPVNPHYGELAQETAANQWANGQFNSGSQNPADYLLRKRPL